MDKCFIFATTVLAALPIRTASQGESFAFIYVPNFNISESFALDYSKAQGFLFLYYEVHKTSNQCKTANSSA